MKNRLGFLFILTFVLAYAQNDQAIYAVMDTNAKKLAGKSEAYSVSIGILKDGKIYTKHYGEIDKGKGNRADDNTYFEIASVTKLFTGQLVAKAVLEGKINLEDDIRKFLNGDYPNLEYNGVAIKIKNLISYNSALPRTLPDDEEILKNLTNETPFLLRNLSNTYSRDQFFKDLKNVKLKGLPGIEYDYSNLSLELTGVILENAYGESIENLFEENLLSRLKMQHTQFGADKMVPVANGYYDGKLMPHFESKLWSSSGMKTISSMGDLMKFMKDEVHSKDKVVLESQRNIDNSKENWHGYFWDDYYMSEYGKVGYKHGGAYGTQTWFAIYPELKMGICMIINNSTPTTFPVLQNAVSEIMEDFTKSSKEKEIYGYLLKGNNIVFSYTHPKNLDAGLLNTVSIAGSFNDWNSENTEYQMIRKDKNRFELKVPISKFEKNKTYSFKFVLNKSAWISAPKKASNADRTPDKNLTLKL
jgi:D-alanyl-D-alanine-carboxypeptidase/D-alanyl-D-alanine-endopeptidase